MTKRVSSISLIEMLKDARVRTLALVSDLNDSQLIGPKLPTVNPLLWEIGHVAYFCEYFVLRQLYGFESILKNKADAIYDSIKVKHEDRWNLTLLNRAETLEYMENIQECLFAQLSKEFASEAESFAIQFAILHEDMHSEAFLWGRQTLGYPKPKLEKNINNTSSIVFGNLDRFVDVPGGDFIFGTTPDEPFLFDNEKWAHSVLIKPFSIAAAPVTNEEFSVFVDEKGYQLQEFWCSKGQKWKAQSGHQQPGYWCKLGTGEWGCKYFDKIIPLAPHQPVIHVNWFEANAYCAWAGLRLPSEVEWEVAAVGQLDELGSLSKIKRRFPWGEQSPDATTSNLDGYTLGCVDVGGFPKSDSAFGCRQMLGNTWEWTMDTFQPFSGFQPDAYQEYSQPLFGKTKVLRGGAWASRARLVRPTYRNFFNPDRWDIFSGFRTCKL
jgi:iron(II)-dependent oxidoreductase